MSATIRFRDGVEATIEDYRWHCDDPQLEALLNGCLDPGGPSGADPAPDVHAAEEMAALLKAEVIRFDVPEAVPGRIYDRCS